MRKKNGITLIALVITIIVLLILAGVSLSLLAGENGVLKRATKASLQTEIASLEEKANLIYADLSMGQYFDENANEKVNLTEIIKELEKENYQFKSEETTENAVTGISVQDMTLKVGETGSLNVILEGNSDGIAYYAQIRGEYYLITLNPNGVKVARTPTKIGNSGESKTLSATALPEGIVIIGEITENDKIPLQAGNTGGTATITVTYGSLTATCQVTVVIRPSEEATPDPSIDFSTNYGTIDVIWLDTNNQVISTPNAPDLYNGGLTPVTWTKNGDTWTEDETAQSNWYNYAEAGEGDTKQSLWANAKNSDGSYFVWIPRYAYRITYYESRGSTKPTGYYDADGMWRASDVKVKYALDAGIETIQHNGRNYIVHPAFVKDNDKEGLENYARGGWDSDLSGFWVAKHEMSAENGKPVSKPNKEHWGNINIGGMYTNSFQYDRSKESHLMKNSEWGAVAYLAHSQYGRNGHEVDINLGAGGVNTSTTGNMYGIFNMSGGSYERTACFDAKASEIYVAGENYGLNMTKEAKDEEGNYISTKYVTKYMNGTSDNNSENAIFEVSKIGDGIKEIRDNSGMYAWFDDYSYVVYKDYPFFLRGGCYYFDGGRAGIFSSHITDRGGETHYTFRTVLAPLSKTFNP